MVLQGGSVSVCVCVCAQNNIVKLLSLARLLPTPEVMTILCVDLMMGKKTCIFNQTSTFEID